MKKFFVCLGFLALSLGITQAQGLHLGVKAGPNLGKISGQSFKDGFNLGYQLGGFAEIDLSQSLGIQPEVIFSQTNTKQTDRSSSTIGDILKPDTKAHLNLLSIPVLLRINSGKMLTFNVGPQFSILTSKGSNLVTDGQEAFKSGDLAAVLGLQLNLGSWRVYGRYNIGLTKINDIASQEKWRSQNIQFGLGYAIF